MKQNQFKGVAFVNEQSKTESNSAFHKATPKFLYASKARKTSPLISCKVAIGEKSRLKSCFDKQWTKQTN
ncbi:MAG: hypothetical protein D6687_09010 [Acidobacteria bacterium]|nr:MAG: hypothetical protein D6687_09010 [Acidobacteriota bacterium]